MAKYRKIDPRIWNDKKFRSLSAEGQRLFLYILTHPSMTSLGAFRATPEGLMSEIGIEHTNEHCKEQCCEQCFNKCKNPFDALKKLCLIKYDEFSKTVFAPNFIKYNQPENANVVIGWKNALDQIPECSLKLEALLRARECVAVPKERSKTSDNKCLLAFDKALKEELLKLKSDFGEGIDRTLNTVSDTVKNTVRNTVAIQEQEQEISTNVDKKKNKKEKSQPLEKPEDVTDTTWADYSLLRDKLKAPLTQTALNAIRKEAEKAGISLEDALKTCCMRGWRGFKSDWIRPKNGTGYVRQTTTPAQEDFMRDDYWANEPEEMIP